MADRGGTDGVGPRSDRGEPASSEYRTLLAALDDGVYRIDADGRFVVVNEALADLTGYDREHLVGTHVSTIVAERDVDRFERLIRAGGESVADDGTRIELTLETAAEELVRCDVGVSPVVDDGEYEGVVGTVRATEPSSDGLPAVWETYASIASVIDEVDVGVFVLDDAMDVVWVDENAERYFGVDRTDLVGRDKRTILEETISDRMADSDTFAETVQATYDDNSYVECFECRVTPGEDREERWLEHRSTPIESGRYAGGRLELYYDVTERKRSEQAHRESERRFQSLVDAVDEYAIFMLDPSGQVVSWNEGAKQLKGYESSAIIGTHFSTFYTEEDQAAGVPERNLENARVSGSVECEGWRVRADGTRFWANVTITAIMEDGELMGFAKVTRDMTDRRAREQQLQRERDLVERILETSPVGIAVVERDGTTSRANDRMADLLGYPADEVSDYIAGDRAMFDTNRDPIPLEERPASRVFETGDPVYEQEVLLDPPGAPERWVSVNATPITDESGTPEQVVTTATDVTDLKALAERRKQALEEREKELTAVTLVTNLLETGDRPVDELLEEFVTELPRFFRNPDRTVVRVSVGDHEHASDGTDTVQRSITASTRTDSGTRIWIEVGLTPTGSDDIDGFLEEERQLIDTLATLLRFHFERREYITDLQAETRRLEQFVYAASHDLQEPLRMISSYLQLVEGRYGDELDEDGREFIAYAVDGAERMRSIIDGLLAYSSVRTQGQEFETVDLNEVLADVRSDLEVRIAETGAEITVDSLPQVEGDPTQLRQVFQNLVSNAIEYSEDSPTVHVEAERSGSKWLVSVTDEGIGIPPSETDRIFEMFERLHGREKHDGTGIGLALCRRIVEHHGGEIRVESDPGEGSTFTVTLSPAAAAPE